MVSYANSGTGPAGVAVTTGNSASGGRPWDLITVGANASLIYDTVDGGIWHRYTTGATASMVRADWTGTTINPGWPRCFGRLYFRIPAATLTASIIYLARLRSGATQTARISVGTNTRMQLRNTGNSAAAAGGVNIAADTTYRLEWDITASGTGFGAVRLFLGDATTHLEEISATSNFGTGLVNEVGFGIPTGTANQAPYWLRGFETNDTAMPGPVGGTTVAAAAALSATSVAAAAGLISLTAAAALSTGASLSAVGQVAATGATALGALSELTATGQPVAVGEISLGATTDMSAAPALVASAGVALDVETELTGTAAVGTSSTARGQVRHPAPSPVTVPRSRGRVRLPESEVVIR